VFLTILSLIITRMHRNGGICTACLKSPSFSATLILRKNHGNFTTFQAIFDHIFTAHVQKLRNGCSLAFNQNSDTTSQFSEPDYPKDRDNLLTEIHFLVFWPFFVAHEQTWQYFYKSCPKSDNVIFLNNMDFT